MRISDWSSDVCSSDLSAVGRKGLRDRAQHRLVARFGGGGLPVEFVVHQHRLAAVIGHGAADGQQIAMAQPGGEQLADDEADAPRIAEIIHVAGAVRIDAREQRHRMAEFVELLPVADDPRRARDRGPVDGMIGRAAGREPAYARVDDRLFEIGSESWRESWRKEGAHSVVAGALKKKK